MRPVVCFDASGVVYTNGTRALIQALVAQGIARAALDALVSGPESWALRRGEIGDAEFWAAVDSPVPDIRRRWLDAFVPQPGMPDLLHELAAAGTALGMIAETVPERVADFDRRFGLGRLFRHPFLSFEHHADKRDGALFRVAAAALAGHRLIMVEDEPASRANAIAAGFECLLFKDAATLRRELAGIL